MISCKTSIGTFILLVISYACSNNGNRKNGVPCDCSEIQTTSKRISFEIENIPNDLTTITTQGKTAGLFAKEIETLGNELFNSEHKIEENDKRWKIIENETFDWLGGPYNGNCGNLAQGHIIADFDYFGNKIDLEFRTTDIHFDKVNTTTETAPYYYQGNVKFRIEMKTKDSRGLIGNIEDNYLVLSSCIKYINVE